MGVGDGASGSLGGGGSGRGDGVHAGAVVPPSPHFGRLAEFEVPDPLALVSTDRSSLGQGSVKRGLSPFLMERNQYMRRVKDARGAKLTDAEITKAHRDFQELWDSIADKDAFSEAFVEWQSGGAKAAAEEEV